MRYRKEHGLGIGRGGPESRHDRESGDDNKG